MDLHTVDCIDGVLFACKGEEVGEGRGGVGELVLGNEFGNSTKFVFAQCHEYLECLLRWDS